MKIKIAISTNINFYKSSLTIVIESLINAGIEKKDIYVFNSGFEEKKYETFDGVKFYFLNHNSFEYSPLIEIVEREIESEYWFLIHDTCKVGNKFKELLYNIPNNNPDKIALKTKPSMSIGSYRYDYLIKTKEKILSIKNTDLSYEALLKWKLWGVPNEDYILWMTDPEPFIYNNNSNWYVIREENWFESNTIRRTEYYESLDLYKNKSNWGQTGDKMVINI